MTSHTNSSIADSNASSKGRIWMAAGLALVALHVTAFVLSPAFPHGRPVLERPVALLVALLVASGIVYLIALMLLRGGAPRGRAWWLWVIGIGLSMRAFVFFSTPMMDDDFYRYLWDGAFVAHGHSPYAHVPEKWTLAEGGLPEDCAALGGVVRERVNHPWLRTIYPPVAQAAFGLAHLIAPWSILGLRAVWALADLGAAVILLALLGAVGAPRSYWVVYWWNPVLLKEVYNSAHMEALLLPLLLGALLLTVRGRTVSGAVVLAFAAGAKLWPVLLLPALLHRTDLRRRAAVATAAVFCAVAGVLTAPLLFGITAEASGLTAYARYWEMNDALYLGLRAAGRLLHPENPHGAARLLGGLLLAGWIAWLCRMPARTPRHVCARALWSVAGLFLLSPTQFPWYWLWLLPFLSIVPVPGLLVLSATLPLYYLRFVMSAHDVTGWFDHGVVWLEFGPALLLLAWQVWNSIRTRKVTPLNPEVLHA